MWIGKKGTLWVGRHEVFLVRDDRVTRWMLADRWDPRTDLARELAWSTRRWNSLAARAASEDARFQLMFSYETPSLDAAQGLAEVIREQRGYDVGIDVRWEQHGSQVTAGETTVSGRTERMTLDLAALHEWIASMIDTGVTNGRCRFAGWGWSQFTWHTVTPSPA